MEAFEKDKKRMDFKTVLQKNNHYHNYLENFKKKYDDFRVNSEVSFIILKNNELIIFKYFLYNYYYFHMKNSHIH